MGGDALRLGR